MTCHTYCDTGKLFIIFISEDPCHSHLWPSVWQWSRHSPSLRLRIVPPCDRTPISRMRGERSTTTPPRQYFSIWIIQSIQKNMQWKNCTFIQTDARLTRDYFFSSGKIFSRNFQNLQFLSIKLVGAVCVQYILISRCLAFLLRSEHLMQDWNSISKTILMLFNKQLLEKVIKVRIESTLFWIFWTILQNITNPNFLFHISKMHATFN